MVTLQFIGDPIMAGVLCRSLVMIKNNDNDDYDADCDVLNCIMSLLCKWIVSVYMCNGTSCSFHVCNPPFHVSV